MRYCIATLLLGVLSLQVPTASGATTLDDVRARGTLKCAVSDNLAGFSFLNSEGEWQGFDVQYCRAFAAAIFGDASKVQIVPTAFNLTFQALQSGDVDVVSHSITYTISRDTQLGLDFLTPNFYTGQSFMVHKELGVESTKGLDGATICVLAGSVTERYISDYFRANGMSFTPVATETSVQGFDAYKSNRCDAISHETPTLAINRTRFADPEAHVILPESIAKSYQAPMVREKDDQWRDILQWTHFALVTAEELGITQNNVDELIRSSTNPVVRTFLGADGEVGIKMGLKKDWTADVIRGVGNYGEIYNSTVGANSALKIERGLNDLAERGGRLFAPSWR